MSMTASPHTDSSLRSALERAWPAAFSERYLACHQAAPGGRVSDRWDATAAQDGAPTLEVALCGVVLAALQAQHADGHLQPLGGVAHRDIWAVSLWNQSLAAGGPLPEALAHAFVFALHSLAYRTFRAPSAEPATAHAAFFDGLMSGNFAWHTMDDGECSTTGERVRFQVDGWQLAAGRILEGEFQPLAPIEAPSIQHVTLPVPSGELWVSGSDFARDLPGLEEALEAFMPPGNSINSVAGREQWTRRCAEQAGVGYVHNQETSCHLVRDGTRWLIGTSQHDPLYGSIDDPDPEPHADGAVECGSLYESFYGVSLFDPTVVVDVLAVTLGREEAQAVVNQYAEDCQDTFVRVAVPPGEVHLYHAGDTQQFHATFQAVGLQRTGFDPLAMVLSVEPLEILDPTPAPSRRLRP